MPLPAPSVPVKGNRKAIFRLAELLIARTCFFHLPKRRYVIIAQELLREGSEGAAVESSRSHLIRDTLDGVAGGEARPAPQGWGGLRGSAGEPFNSGSDTHAPYPEYIAGLALWGMPGQ